MECFWHNLVGFFKVFFSYIVAIARLVVWTILFFFLGLQRTLFMRSEVVGIDFSVLPLRCDMEEADDKLAYLDKLCTENPELTGAEDDSVSMDDILFEDDEDGEEDDS